MSSPCDAVWIPPIHTLLPALIASALLSCGGASQTPALPGDTGVEISASPTDEQAPPPTPEPSPEPAFGPIEVEPGEDGWEVYTGEIGVTAETAADLAPGTSSPEAAVVHFYASLMRGDSRYEEVLVPERSERLQRKLDKALGWKFRKIRLERRKPSGEGELWIKVWFELEIDGQGESGTDDVGVQQIDGQWYVSSVPT